MSEVLPRSFPSQVGGSLVEYLERLRNQVFDIHKSTSEYKAELIAKKVPHAGVLANIKRFEERKIAQSSEKLYPMVSMI